MSYINRIFFYATDFCNISDYAPPCKYACRCDGPCDSNGNCIGSSCSHGWFGSACQYADLLYEWAGSDPLIKIFHWNKPVLFTWLRLQFYSKASLNDLSLFLDGKLCQKSRIFLVDDKTLDIACDDNVLMTQLKLIGEIDYIKTLHLSGGRNVALFQKSYQSSTMSSYASYQAVHGFINVKCLYFGCSRTDLNDTSPWWTVFFDQQYIIYRCVLYKMYSEQKTMDGFVLEMLDSNNATLYRYQDDSNSSARSYSVFIKEGGYFAAKVSQQQTASQEFAASIDLTEFEAYGDCVPGFWGSTCRDKCPTSCSLSCHPDHGKCSICIGYTDPPNCSIECDETHFGLNCTKNCSSQCSDTVCDSKNGRCKACISGYRGDFCDRPCYKRYFGLNCKEKCSSQCSQAVCDHVTGSCITCIPGYIGEFCNISCDETHFGQNCTKNCSSQCSQTICDSKTGRCKACIPGYRGDFCDRPCYITYFGINCEEKCSSQCSQAVCDHLTGSCITCIPGYIGEFCNI
ncbi:multiple epidermal growth factor domains protein 11, partial [Biomphalaria glabrata]